MLFKKKKVARVSYELNQKGAKKDGWSSVWMVCGR
jgi:hypothetical protein